MWYVMRVNGYKQEFLASNGRWTSGTRMARVFYTKSAAETCVDLLTYTPGWAYRTVGANSPVLQDVA